MCDSDEDYERRIAAANRVALGAVSDDDDDDVNIVSQVSSTRRQSSGAAAGRAAAASSLVSRSRPRGLATVASSSEQQAVVLSDDDDDMAPANAGRGTGRAGKSGSRKRGRVSDGGGGIVTVEDSDSDDSQTRLMRAVCNGRLTAAAAVASESAKVASKAAAVAKSRGKRRHGAHGVGDDEEKAEPAVSCDDRSLTAALALLEAKQAALRRTAAAGVQALAEARTSNAGELLRKQAAAEGPDCSSASDALGVAEGAVIILDVKTKDRKVSLRQRAVRIGESLAIPQASKHSSAANECIITPLLSPRAPVNSPQRNNLERAFVELTRKFGAAAKYSFDGRALKPADTPVSAGMCDDGPDEKGEYRAQVDVVA